MPSYPTKNKNINLIHLEKIIKLKSEQADDLEYLINYINEKPTTYNSTLQKQIDTLETIHKKPIRELLPILINIHDNIKIQITELKKEQTKHRVTGFNVTSGKRKKAKKTRRFRRKNQ